MGGTAEDKRRERNRNLFIAMKFNFSKHAIERIQDRGISKAAVTSVIQNPIQLFRKPSVRKFTKKLYL